MITKFQKKKKKNERAKWEKKSGDKSLRKNFKKKETVKIKRKFNHLFIKNWMATINAVNWDEMVQRWQNSTKYKQIFCCLI